MTLTLIPLHHVEIVSRLYLLPPCRGDIVRKIPALSIRYPRSRESYHSRPTAGGSMILWDRVSLLKNRRHDNLRKLSSAFDNRVRYRHAWYIPREIVAHRVPLKFNRTNYIPQGGPGKNNTSAGKCIRIPTCAATASKRFEEETCHCCQMIEL